MKSARYEQTFFIRLINILPLKHAAIASLKHSSKLLYTDKLHVTHNPLIRSGERLTLETSASLSVLPYGVITYLINLFDCPSFLCSFDAAPISLEANPRILVYLRKLHLRLPN